MRVLPEATRLKRVRDRIRDYLELHVADPETVDEIVLAIEEACTNAIRHSGSDAELAISLRFSGDHLDVGVTDGGAGFDVTSFDPQRVPDVTSTGGRGLYLIACLMDGVAFDAADAFTVRMDKQVALRAARDRRSRAARSAPVESLPPKAIGGPGLGMVPYVESISELFWALDWEYRLVYMNGPMRRTLRIGGDEVLGHTMHEVFPGFVGTDFEHCCRDAMELGQSCIVEHHSTIRGNWYEFRVYPTASGLSVYGRNINARKRVELERERLIDELARRQRLAGALDELNAVANSALDQPLIMERVTQLAGRALSAGSTMIILRAGASWRVAYAWGAWSGAAGRLFAPAETPHLEACYQKGVTVRVDDYTKAMTPGASVRAIAPLRSGLFVPLENASGRVGAFVFLWHDAPQTIDTAIVDFGEKAAAAASLALINATLYASLEHEQIELERLADRRERELETLERILSLSPDLPADVSFDQAAAIICADARATFGCDAASLYSIDGTEARLLAREPLAPDSPPGSTLSLADLTDPEGALAEGRPSFLRWTPASTPGSTTTADPRAASELRLPLATEGKVVALVVLSWTRAANEVDDWYVAVAQHFVERAALALETLARRAAQAQREALSRTLDRIVRLSPAIHAESSVADTAVAACAAARRVFGCDRALLFAVDRARLVPSASDPADEPLPVLTIAGELFSDDADRPNPCLARSGESPCGWLCEALGYASVLVVPLSGVADHDSVMVFGWRHNVSPPRTELGVVQRFADQVDVALAQAVTREARDEANRLHARLEAGLLPRAPLAHPAFEIRSLYRSGLRALTLGGDFFDVMAFGGGRLALVIGDVSGHGPDAAALGSTLRDNWKALNLSGASLPTIMRTLESVLLLERRDPATFATVAGAWIDPSESAMRLALAGHPPPVLIMTGDAVEVSAKPELPLGLAFEQRTWQAARVDIPTEAHLLFYTDGLVEGRVAPDSQQRLGIERLAGLVRREVSTGGDGVMERVAATVEKANGGPLRDDAAAVLLSRRPRRARRGRRDRR